MAFEYVKKDTSLDRMNPLVKLLYMSLALLLVIQVWNIESISLLLIWIAIATAWWIVGKVELRSLGFLLKLLTFLFVFLFIVQGLTYRFGDRTVIFKFFHFPIIDADTGLEVTNYGELTVGGILFGLLIALRVVGVVTVIPIFTMTSSIAHITAAFAKIRVPQKMAFMFMTAFRFVPLVQESMDSIIEAQKIRGFDLDQAGYVDKVRRAYVPIVTPLLLLMFRRAMDLEVAINARAFGAMKERTYIEDMSFKARDYAGILVVFASFGLMMYLLYIEPTFITWVILTQAIGIVVTGFGAFLTVIGVPVALQTINGFLLTIPVLDLVGGYFNNYVLAGYGAIFVVLFFAYIGYWIIRRRRRKRKRAKQ
ncbi:MAG: energy-coupling factor transporter transmembrane component T family protein [Promethearchaeota archaeon]